MWILWCTSYIYCFDILVPCWRYARSRQVFSLVFDFFPSWNSQVFLAMLGFTPHLSGKNLLTDLCIGFWETKLVYSWLAFFTALAIFVYRWMMSSWASWSFHRLKYIFFFGDWHHLVVCTTMMLLPAQKKLEPVNAATKGTITCSMSHIYFCYINMLHIATSLQGSPLWNK